MGKQEPLAGKLLVRKAFPIALGGELFPGPRGASHPLARSDPPPGWGPGSGSVGNVAVSNGSHIDSPGEAI